MSSRTGVRPMGSDGRDFTHREKIATHYKQSVLNKSRFKTISALHFGLFALVALALSESLLKVISIKPPQAILSLNLPAAEPWQYMWLISISSTFFGLLSLTKNATVLLKQYIVGTVIFGLLPVVYAVYTKGFELLNFVQHKRVRVYVLGFPYVVLLFMFLTIALQIHGFGIYFSVQLLKSWRSKGGDKKK